MARKIVRKTQNEDVRNITVRDVTSKVGKLAATAVLPKARISLAA